MLRRIPQNGVGFMLRIVTEPDRKLFEHSAASAEAELGRDLTNLEYLRFLQEFYIKHRQVK